MMSPNKFDRSLIPSRPDFHFETQVWRQGYTAVAGIDEAGRGALAGPVVAAAVIFPPEPELLPTLNGVRDSKVMSSNQRELWAGRVANIAVTYAVGFASCREIDEFGIMSATYLAMARAIDDLEHPPQHLLLDYLKLPDSSIPQTALVKGDARSLSIAAASILAKVARDSHLCHLDEQYPGYGFAKNKGYGTAAHRQALIDLGISPAHRRSFNFRKPNTMANGGKKLESGNR